MIKKIKTENHEDWLRLRAKYIGGSDAAAVMGLNPFTSRYALWAEKTGRMPSFEGNLATDVGAYLEEFIAKRFEKETGKKVRRENASIFNDDHPFAIANVDRLIVGEDAGLECKSTSALQLKHFKNGDFPARYYVQCVHYLAITGKQRWYLACLIGNNEFKVFTIERDEDEIRELMNAEREFYDTHIKGDLPPAIDGTDSSSEAVKTVHMAEEENEVDISDIEDEIDHIFDLKKQIKLLEGMKTESENKIKSYLGKNTFGSCPSAYVSWRAQERLVFDRKAFERAYPNIDTTQFYTIQNSRILRIKRIGE